MYLVDMLHQRGIGVILDWVPSHFPDRRARPRVLRRHAPVRARRPAPGLPPRVEQLHLQLRPQRGARFLLSSALFWLEQLPHRRPARRRASPRCSTSTTRARPGEWIPNAHGGTREPRGDRVPAQLNERGLPRLSRTCRRSPRNRPRGRWCRGPTYARRPRLRHEVEHGLDARHARLLRARPGPPPLPPRRSSRSRIWYAFTENFVLPLSHDEVVHGKGSLIAQDAGRRLAAVRQPAPAVRLHVGAAGQEAAVHGRRVRPVARVEPRARARLGPARATPTHAGRAALGARPEPRCIATQPALHELDFDAGGFEWIDCHDAENSVLAFLRSARGRPRRCWSSCNFTPVPRHDYRVGVPQPRPLARGAQQRRARLRRQRHGQPGRRRGRRRSPAHGRAQSLSLTLPPLGVLFFAARG